MRLNDVDIAPYSTVLLDRDGTVNVHLVGDYVKCPEEFRFVPGAKEAIVAMSRAGKRVYIITNQRGVGRGLMSEADLAAVHRYMVDQVEKAGGHIDGIYCCTATKADDPRRKPQTGMWQELLRDHPDPKKSRMMIYPVVNVCGKIREPQKHLRVSVFIKN